MNKQLESNMKNTISIKTTLVSALLLIASLVGLTDVSKIFAAEEAKFEPFTFVQLCDTQLGMGGYEHDINTFRQAVSQIIILVFN